MTVLTLPPARPLLSCPPLQGFFESTVVLVLQHSAAEGTTGVILNHPMHDDAGALEGARGEELGQTLAAAAVRLGGPVEMHSCLVGLAARPFDGSEEALPGVHWGPVLGLEGLPPEAEPAVFLGYSGWGPGQLAEELGRGCWSVVSASPGLVFGAAQLGPAAPGMRPGGGRTCCCRPTWAASGTLGTLTASRPSAPSATCGRTCTSAVASRSTPAPKPPDPKLRGRGGGGGFVWRPVPVTYSSTIPLDMLSCV